MYSNINMMIQLGIGVGISILFCYYTVRRKSLTLGGALTASFVGLWVLWFAGARWLIPLFFFFITGTLLGHLSKNKSQTTDAKHGKARDALQVLCNGGIYAVLATFAQGAAREMMLSLMLVSMAICTADTWASEIGIYFRWKTYDVLRFRKTPVGLSGGVSVPGTLGGLLGALAMAALGNALLPDFLKPDLLLFITISGFVGMLLDSIMGASLQARYRNVQTETLSDSTDKNTVLQSGWRWMTNDAVNFWSNAVVTVGMALYLHLVD